MKIKPLKLLLFGFVISTFGGYLRIMKFEYSEIFLILGTVLIFGAGIIYLINRKKDVV